MATTPDIEQLFNIMMQFGKLMLHQSAQTYEERTATMLQFSALNFLKDHSDSSVGDLARFLQLSKSSATQLTERLVKTGAVERVEDPQDRRIIRLVLTSGGEKEFIVLKKDFMGKMKKFISKIPDRDIRELIRIYNNLIETLKKEQYKK